MRKILICSLMVGLASLPLVACDDEADADETTTTVPDGGVTPPPATKFHAAKLVDGWKSGDGCNSPNNKAEGYDPDAISLSDKDNQLVGYCEVMGGSVPTSTAECGANDHSDINEAKGEPNGTLKTGYVSLAGGTLTCEFSPNSPEIQAGDTLETFEIDKSVSSTAKDEAATLSITEAADCGSRTDCKEKAVASVVSSAVAQVSGL